MTLDPAGLEAAAKLARSCTPTAREDARLAEQIVRAYLAAAPDTGRSVLMHVPVTPTTENPPENVYARLRNRPPEPSAAVAWDEGYVAGFAAGRAAATSDQPEPCEKCRVWSSHCPRCAAATPDPRNGCRAPHCFSEYGTPCGTCPALAASADKGWSPGIDDPEPPALGDIDTGEGWYQT